MCIGLAVSAQLSFAETKGHGEKSKGDQADAKLIALEMGDASTSIDHNATDTDPAGMPRGVNGACCNPFGGQCTIQPNEGACQAVLGEWQGAGTSCTPNMCIQPLDCFNLSPNGTLVSILPESQANLNISPSDENNGNVALDYFPLFSHVYFTEIRWWGLYSQGAVACTPNAHEFRIRTYNDAAGPGSGPTAPGPRVICDETITVTPLLTSLTLGGRQVFEFTATIPQCAIAGDVWLEIQAVDDGGTCIFNWASGDDPGSLDGNTSLLNGTQVNWDLSLCLATSNFDTPTGACCDDDLGTCTENELSFLCTGPANRFTADTPCANVVPPCGQVTGSCCATFSDGGGAFEEGDCAITTAGDCANTFGGGGVWGGAFTDCTPNPCKGACCLGDGTCVEVTLNSCNNQGGQYFGDASTCAMTACPGTGRCCFNAGTECTIVTEAACIANFAGDFTDGLTCQVACPIPPTNDECAQAIPILCGTNVTVDNTTATENPGDPLFSCQFNGPNPGVGTIWFSFEATDTTAFVQTCDSVAPADDTLIAVYDGTCGGLVEIACSEDDCNGLLSELCVENLIIGNTYFIQAASFAEADRGAITVQVDCPCPSGACCTDAGCQTQTPQSCAAAGGTYLGDDIVCNPTSCFGACCFADGTCADLDSGDCANQLGFFEGVGTFCANTVCPIRPTNLTCDTALLLDPVTDLPYAEVLGFEFATSDGPTGSCDGFGAVGTMQNDLWWEITPTENCQLRVTVTPAAGFDPIIVIRDSCIPGTELACADETALGVVEQLEFILTQGVTYFIQIGDTGVAPGGGDATVEILCGQVGSCCLPDNRCVVNQDADCAALGGTFGGPDTDCGFRGACCLPGTCVVTSQECCIAAAGAYVGDGTSCGDVAGMPDTYSSGPVGLPINDNAATLSDINVPDIGSVADVNVSMNIAHTFQADLEIDVIHSGITVRVMEDQCGGNNDINATWDDEAAGPVVCAEPTVGTFMPLNALDAFDGTDRSGIWTLSVFDDAGADQGTLNDWAVIIDGVGASPCDAGTGACCIDEVTCTPNQTVAQCSAAGGTYLGNDTICEAGACDIRGACCDNITGGCTVQSEANCIAGNGTYQGDFSNCSTTMCPIILGACCNADATCSSGITFDNCEGVGGFWQGPNSVCSTLTGACCYPGAECRLATQECCDATSGLFQGVGITCGGESDSGFVGLAINDNATTMSSINVADPGTLSDVDVFLDITHTWIGDLDISLEHNGVTIAILNDPCGNFDDLLVTLDDAGAPIVCGAPTTGVVIPTNPLAGFNGLDKQGLWNLSVFDDTGGDTGTLNQWRLIVRSDGDINPCQSGIGACCTSESVCVDNQSFEQCNAANGLYLGVGSVCSPGICSVVGACCDPETGLCTEVSQLACENGGGLFQGNNSNCATTQCAEVPGACCNTDGSCSNNVTFLACTGAGGSWQGASTSCPALGGACCLPGGFCLVTSQECCLNASGAYVGDGTNCGDASGNPDTYPSGAVNLAINDNAATLSDINVPDSGSVADVNVSMNIFHTFQADLEIDVIHLGVTVRVMQDECGGNNDINATWDDEAAGPVVCAEPTVGTFIPLNLLSAFDGLNRQGIWTLSVFDDAGADQGTLNDWAVIIDGPGVSPCDGGTGACCIDTVTCVPDQTIQECSTAGGTYLGLGTTCSAGVCDLMGACCNIITSACTVESEASCIAGNGVYQGDFTNCGTTNCPIILGACCNADATCSAGLTFDACEGPGGTWQGPNSVCSTVTGGCCLSTGACLITTQDCCENVGGGYVGDGSNCGDSAGNPVSYPSGPIGLPLEDVQPAVISTITVPDSFTVGDVNVHIVATHTFVGDLCATLEHNGVIVELIQRSGADNGSGTCHTGTPFGCGGNNYDVVLDDEGAGGNIEDMCNAAGDNPPSPPNFEPFEPLSAFDGQPSAGDWTLTISDNAAGDLGTMDLWDLVLDGVGANPCDNNPGACCLPDETCAENQTPVECSALNGVYQGIGTACIEVDCTIRGACCNTIDGTCRLVEDGADCNLTGEVYQGDNTDCASIVCPAQRGACCLPDATCVPNLTVGECEVDNGGVWQGDGSACGTVTGACCLPATCIVATADCCSAAGGTYQGDGAPCGTAAGNPTPYTSNPGLAIPDTAQASDTISVPDSFTIGDVDVQIGITHTWVGDLTVTLEHVGTGTTATLVMEPQTAGGGSCPDASLNVTVDDEGTGGSVDGQCIGDFASDYPTSPPSFTPSTSLSVFDGLSSNSDWVLTVADGQAGDVGTIDTWTILLDGIGQSACDETGCQCPGDVNSDGSIDGLDIQAFTTCLLTGAAGCECGDINGSGDVTMSDLPLFVNILLNGSGPCSGTGPICTTCQGDANSDGIVDSRDLDMYMSCLINGGSCPCTQGMTMSDMVSLLLNSPGLCP